MSFKGKQQIHYNIMLHFKHLLWWIIKNKQELKKNKKQTLTRNKNQWTQNKIEK